MPGWTVIPGCLPSILAHPLNRGFLNRPGMSTLYSYNRVCVYYSKSISFCTTISCWSFLHGQSFHFGWVMERISQWKVQELGLFYTQ